MVGSEKKVIELQPHPKQTHREANPFDLALGLQPRSRTSRVRAADESRSQQMAAASSTQEAAWRPKKKAA